MKKNAIALGIFDGVHLGHQNVIKNAVNNNLEMTPCVLTFDISQKKPRKKAKSPRLISEEIRNQLFNKLGVENIFVYDFIKIKDLSPEEFFENILIKELNAGFISCGEDFHFGKNAQGDVNLLYKLCKSFGVTLKVEKQFKINNEVVSSTAIRRLICNGNITKANKFLGYEYTIESVVVKGNQIGRTLGFKTANQLIPSGFVLPKFGVYASKTVIDGKEYFSVTNIGKKPTVSGENLAGAETNIFDLDKDLYGQTISVKLLEFVRPEIKFENLDHLKSQISSDVAKVKALEQSE